MAVAAFDLYPQRQGTLGGCLTANDVALVEDDMRWVLYAGRWRRRMESNTAGAEGEQRPSEGRPVPVKDYVRGGWEVYDGGWEGDKRSSEGGPVPSSGERGSSISCLTIKTSFERRSQPSKKVYFYVSLAAACTSWGPSSTRVKEDANLLLRRPICQRALEYQ